jgi:hypothetical protein
MTRVTIDTKGAGFHTIDEDGDRVFSESMEFFLRQAISLARQLFSSGAGGRFTLTIPEHSASAEVDLELNPIQDPVSVAAGVGIGESLEPCPEPNHGHICGSEGFVRPFHDGASENRLSEVASGAGVFIPGPIGGL